jgi:hypothetical protein
MGARARVGSCYVCAAMLAAALAGRALDAGAWLPGVHEASVVRGGGWAWLTAVACALGIGAAAAMRWRRTGSLAAVAVVVVPTQLAAFLAAEAVARIATGLGPLDADGLVGAGLQAAVAVLLLLALTCAWTAGLRATPLEAGALQPASHRPMPQATSTPASTPASTLFARGPPLAAGT